MSKIYVRAVPGRVSRIEPKGRYLGYEKFIPTLMSPYAARRIAQGDWEVRDSKPKAQKVEDAPKEPKRAHGASVEENGS